VPSASSREYCIRFDIHALFFSEDAVTLENELDRHFADRAVSMANRRKEFFFATPSQVREVLTEKVGNLLEFTENAERQPSICNLSGIGRSLTYSPGHFQQLK